MDYSTSDRHAKSWRDLIATIVIHGGETLEDVDLASMDFSATRSRGRQDKHGKKFARTHGTSDVVASATFYDTGWEAFRPALKSRAAKLGVSIFDVPFDIIGKRKSVDSDEVETIKFFDCCLNENSATWAEGDDPFQRSVALDVMKIVEIDDGEEVILG